MFKKLSIKVSSEKTSEHQIRCLSFDDYLTNIYDLTSLYKGEFLNGGNSQSII